MFLLSSIKRSFHVVGQVNINCNIRPSRRLILCNHKEGVILKTCTRVCVSTRSRTIRALIPLYSKSLKQCRSKRMFLRASVINTKLRVSFTSASDSIVDYWVLIHPNKVQSELLLNENIVLLIQYSWSRV